jgi:hypothetical protein
MKKRVLSFSEYITEAKIPTPPKPDQEPTATAAPAPGGADGVQTDSSLTSTTGAPAPAAPGTAPVAGAPGAAPAATNPDGSPVNPAEAGDPAAAGTENLGGGGGMGGDMGGGGGALPIGGGGGSMGAPAGDVSMPAEDAAFKPQVSSFPVVINDETEKYHIEYPDGGGVKRMKGYEVSWGSLEDWIATNNLSTDTEEITKFLQGEDNKLKPEIKEKLKKALADEKLGEADDEVEIEFDEEGTPYSSDLATVILNFNKK